MRMERLELSKQKLLGPKSSASTNFATSANFILLIYIYVYISKIINYVLIKIQKFQFI
jgi:hypothetical protein